MRALAVALVCLATLAPVRAAAVTLAVIVHPSRTDRLDRRDVERIYLKIRRFWGDGVPIVPLNLEADSPLRAAFVAQVLSMDSARLAAYWNERYFNGVFPPTVLSSPAAVKRYVATDARAIGYVDARDVDESVRVILTLEE